MCKSNILIFVLIIVFVLIVQSTGQLTIHCDYKNSSTVSNGKKVWETVVNPYACIIDTLEVISKLHVTNVTGTHIDDYTNNDVRALKIIGDEIIPSDGNSIRDEVISSCEIIPSGFGLLFPYIEALSITQARLKTVSSRDFKQFSNLREIWLDWNELEFLESKLFQFNPNVELISFISNKIKYIGRDFFDYLPKLVNAFFQFNKCLNEKVTIGTEFNALKEKIKEKCYFSETTWSLEVTVDCQYQISSDWELVKDPYECNLVSLGIMNKLLAINATGTHLPGHDNDDVKAITIYDGICNIIPSALGSIFPNIEALAVWNSSLKFVSSNDLQQFSNLREIWLLGNDLEYLESNLFVYNPRVEIVVVRSNKIKYVGAKCFDFLQNLRKVDFSDNECLDEISTDAVQISDIKKKIRQKCDVPGRELGIHTTIREYNWIYLWLDFLGLDYSLNCLLFKKSQASILRPWNKR